MALVHKLRNSRFLFTVSMRVHNDKPALVDISQRLYSNRWSHTGRLAVLTQTLS